MTYYLIKDFTDGQEFTPRVVSDDPSHKPNIWDELEMAREGKRKIAVCLIGPCVLDWS